MARNTNTRKPAATTPAAKPAPKATTPKSEPKPAPSNCRCGCGAPTITAKAAFVSGHDARLAGVLGRAMSTPAGLTDEQVIQYKSISERLQAKADRVAETAKKREAAKAAAKTAKIAAKAAYAKAMADALA